jgi:hypothetical protein
MLQNETVLLERLKSVFSLEQLELVADACSRAQGRAVDRRCNQSVEVVFNDKGFPRFVTASDSVVMPAPKMYVPE